MKPEQRLKKLFDLILDLIKNDPGLALRVEEALGIVEKPKQAKTSKKKGSRAPAVLDPVAEFMLGEPVLRERLKHLSLEQLKDILAEFAMDPAGNIARGRKPEKFIDHITITARSRAKLGDAFRG